MAGQRYAQGAANVIEQLDAQASMQTAERDCLNALHDYFRTDLTRLEGAPGDPPPARELNEPWTSLVIRDRASA